jgi:competence protein ComEA
MFKKLLAIIAFLFYAAASFAANVDVNTASATDLDALKGIGPAIAGRIVEARQQGPFKDWNDLIDRVKGIGHKNAIKFSTEGMTVSGTSYQGAPAVAAPPPAKSARQSKAAAPAETPAPAAPAATPAVQTPQAETTAPATKKHRERKSKKAEQAATPAATPVAQAPQADASAPAKKKHKSKKAKQAALAASAAQ